MRTRAIAVRRTVVALVVAVALAAAPLARADDTASPGAGHSATRPTFVLAMAVAFAVTLTVLVLALRAPAVDTSRLRTATDALDRAIARGRGERFLEVAANDTRWAGIAHVRDFGARRVAPPPMPARVALGAPRLPDGRR